SFTVTTDAVTVSGATVTLADVPASNGVIHVIDTVLMPPADLVDVPATAISTGIHTSLVAALTAADLVSALQADGPFTVFAPTDDAFAAAGIDLASFDTDEEIATLADILTYHVVSGQVMSTDLTDGMTATALNGDELSFTVTTDAVTVSGATVTLADVPASNGVIHVIDTVLMPPADPPVIPEGCDYLVGIDDTGYAFDHVSLEIAVGETVCWIWTDSSMAHNVAETATAEDTTRLVGGLYSGVAETTVDYRVTFDADETFTYICEPHASMNMNGVVVVGTGVEDVAEPIEKEDTDATPGFGGVLLVLAVMGAVLVTTQRSKLD
ncbi:MAG: fasciclin domain-containing protein, partial [Candidatus Thalassarchaeaceae archaeon]